MLIVQKFGGTSVGNLERIKNVANIVKSYREKGDDLVVVVSAMAGETNKLLEYAHYFTPVPPQREVDLLVSSGERITSALLSIALQSMGVPAIALTGRQAGIKTTSDFTKARIKEIESEKIKKHLNEGKVVIIAGFQGINENGEVTTLGRGGSDLTAVAIAGAIGADKCQIFTDVDGIYTTDPRIEPNARKIEVISYDEMLELASLGAKVMQSRSVELGKKLNIPIEVKSSFEPFKTGTLITKESKDMERIVVSGVAIDRDQARVSIFGVDDKPGISADIFGRLAANNINVDMIVQNVGHDGKANLTFTVPKNELELARVVLEDYNEKASEISFDPKIVKVSVVGIGMRSHSGVAAIAFKALADRGINILMITTSEIKISMVVDEDKGEEAVRALHQAYGLEKASA
ncbi:MAG: aspartate kinase [Epsilonproteobacteria bacterium]|jgi:aspartate kinase|nr:aspartate kinase [Campylobacterota bacterium]NPA89222.1 aspartate kinase [Campylobacterota bacterium]